MNYREQLEKPLSKRYVDHLVVNINDNPSDFSVIYKLIFDSEIKVAWRAAWACQKISEKHPDWFSERQFNELSNLAISTKHGGLQRGCISILYNLGLPNPIPVELINACFEWMVSPRFPIAVQAYSMKMLYRICQKEPDFKPEMKAYLENVTPEDYSAGFNSSRKNILKLLNNI
jgi:hypothetical protein